MFDDDDFDGGIQRNNDSRQGLHDVERALSVLDGRHPDRVRAERESREAAERRVAELEAQAEAAKRRTRKRVAVGVATVLSVSALGYLAWSRVVSAKAEAARIEPLASRFVARGFSPAARGMTTPEGEAEADVSDRACVVVIAAPDSPGAEVRVEHGGKSEVVRGSGMFCTCASEHVRATAHVPVRVLSIDAASVGGMRAIDLLDPRPTTALPSGEACGIDAFAAWVSGPRAPETTPPTVPAPLAELGFTPVAGGKPPFTVVHDAPENSCFLATSASTITLESNDGAALATGPALAFCDGPTQLHVLSGPAAIAVLAAPAKRVGGPLGLREAASRASVRDLVMWTSDDELGRAAAATLSASVVPDPTSHTGALRKEVAPSARVLSFLGRPGGKAAPDELFNAPTYDADATVDVSFVCEPAGTDAPESVCVQSGPLTWKPHGTWSASAVAYGPLPFWLGALDAATSREATAAKLSLVRLARRLVARGFDPTIIEGITEKPRGVEVLGRSGEDAMVAVGLWPTPPYAVAYSQGARWTLDDAQPPFIPIAGGARVELEAPVPPTSPEKARRTVVFRRASSPKKL